MLVAGGAALIAAAARLARLAWPLLFAALPMLYRNPLELLYGLEAAAAMFALSLLILAICLYMRDPQRWQWHFAAIAFALPWVRLEYIAISLAATVALCVIEWSRQERRSPRLSELANLRPAYIPLIGAIAGILIYFAYNGLVFGGALPVSAAFKLAWSQSKVASEGGYDFAQIFRETLQIGVFDYELLIAFEICAYLLLIWWFALRSNKRRDWLFVAFLIGMFGLAAGHLAKFAHTVLVMPYYGTNPWSFVPAYLMTALIIPARLYIAIYLIRRFLAPRWRIAANVSGITVLVIGVMFLLGRAGFAEPFKWVNQKSENIYHTTQISAYMDLQIVNRSLPEDSVIGSWSAGVIGYFSRFPVVHIEGLVNSYEHFNIMRQAGLMPYKYDILVEPQMMEISRRYGITHFANFRRLNDPTNATYMGVPYDIPGYREYQFRLWSYDLADAHAELDYSQQVWDSMKPRFDYLSDGVGVVLNGRMAQAFAKDCLQDEPLAWTWQERKHERILIEPSLYRSSANMCAAQRVLPRGDGQPQQVKIAPMKAYFANLTAERAPIIRSDFDVHLTNGSLIYAKSHCSQADVEARFFANIYPVDADALSADRKRHGYEIIDFSFDDYGAIAADGRCWAALNLPNYPIAQIHAGQYIELADGYAHIWEGAYRLE